MRPIQDLTNDSDLSRDDMLVLALDMARESGVAAARSVFELIGRDEGLLEDPRAQEVLITLLVGMIDALEKNESALVTEALSAATPDVAALARDLLLVANFPEGEIDADQLDDASALCFAALACAAGDRDGAIAYLDAQHAIRPTVDFNRASYPVRAWVMGLDHGIQSLWTRRVPDMLSDLGAVWRKARAAAEAGRHADALDAFGTALALPVADEKKFPVIEDLAIFAAYLRVLGEDEILAAPRLLLALRANPAACRHAVAHLAEANGRPAWRALPRPVLADTLDYFADFPNIDLYPLRNGKPHVDVVWLEITNFCNQKCTFCPDMHREDAREWMPLDRVKSLIDQLAEGVSVGSMQLNAYGEPLLHPHIDEILAYIREKKLPWPTYFTTHGLTLVDKKLKQLSNNYPAGIAVSMHNDGQESYELTRSAKIGDYDTLIARLRGLLTQMVAEQAPSHVRIYQMISNGREDQRVHPDVRRAFPDSPERFVEHVRKWEAIGREIAALAPEFAQAETFAHDEEWLKSTYRHAGVGTAKPIPVLQWTDLNGNRQTAIISSRPVGTYANLLLEYDPEWHVGRSLVNDYTCGFTRKPSLAIFATGKLGICCLDMNSTATFGDLADFPDIAAALNSPQASTIFAELSNGVATSKGCQICLSGDTRKCAS